MQESHYNPNNEITLMKDQCISEQQQQQQQQQQQPRIKWWPVLVMSVVTISEGSSISFSGVVQPQLTQSASDDDFSLTAQEIAIFNSLVFAGNMAGACLSWPLSSLVGQRIVIVLGLFLSAFTWLALILTTRLWVLYLARFTHGMCLNLLTALSTSYMVETADKNSRGWQNGTLYVCKSVGLLVPAIATMAGLNWRQTGTLCCVLSLVPIPSLLLLPDSPRWLMTRGRNTDVQKSLKYFRGDNCEIESEYSSIAAQAVKEGPGNICHQTSMLFRAPTRQTMGLLLMMMVIIYFGGSQLVITYLVPILQLTKTGIDPYQISILCFMSRILGAILFVCLTHRLKRKPLIVAGLINTSLSYGMIGLYFFLERFEVSRISWMPVAAILIILFSDGCAFPGYHTMEGELLPLSCRTTGILALKCAGGISGVVNNMTYEKMIVALGKDATFLFYGALGAICPFVVMFRFQETHGVALEELTNNTGQERRADS